MTKPAVSVGPDTTLYEASLVMDRRRIRRLPVVRDGRLVGIITRSDVAEQTGRSPRSDSARRRSRETPVSRIMSARPITVSPADGLDAAAQIMLKRKVSGLPVVEGGRLVGMITESDVFFALCSILGFTQKGARVVLSLQPGLDLIGQLQKAVGNMGVQGIVSYFNPENKSWEAVVRVRGRKAEPAAAPTE
jgi:acetoin utilization protein AcuB